MPRFTQRSTTLKGFMIRSFNFSCWYIKVYFCDLCVICSSKSWLETRKIVIVIWWPNFGLYLLVEFLYGFTKKAQWKVGFDEHSLPGFYFTQSFVIRPWGYQEEPGKQVSLFLRKRNWDMMNVNFKLISKCQATKTYRILKKYFGKHISIDLVYVGKSQTIEVLGQKKPIKILLFQNLIINHITIS